MARFARLSTVDLVDLAVEAPDTTMNVGLVLRLGGAPTLADLRRVVGERVGGRLRQVLFRPGPLAGRPLWIDDPSFAVERHVDEIRLPSMDEVALLDLAGRLLSPPLPRSRPLWRMWLVCPQSQPAAGEAEVALVVVMHHVVADGAAALQLLATLVDRPEAAEPSRTEAGRTEAGRTEAGRTEPGRAGPPGWAELVSDNLRSRLDAARQAWSHRRVRPAAARRGGALTGFLVPSSKTSLNRPIGPGRRLSVLRFDLEEVRRVAHDHGGTINDAVLALVTGGVRALLTARGEPPGGLRLHAGMAVSLRPSGSPADPGNRTGAMLVRLPVGEADPGARMGRLHAEVIRARGEQAATAPNRVMLGVARMGLLRPFTRHQRLVSTVESNVVGPREPLCLLGAPVLDLVPVGNLAGNLGLAFLAMSYVDRLVLTVQADPDGFPDLDVLTAAIGREWDQLTRR